MSRNSGPDGPNTSFSEADDGEQTHGPPNERHARGATARVRFLATVVMFGFSALVLQLAHVLDGGLAGLLLGVLPMAGYLLADRLELGEIGAVDHRLATDGGQDRETDTGGSVKGRDNN